MTGDKYLDPRSRHNPQIPAPEFRIMTLGDLQRETRLPGGGGTLSLIVGQVGAPCCPVWHLAALELAGVRVFSEGNSFNVGLFIQPFFSGNQKKDPLTHCQSRALSGSLSGRSLI